MQKLKAVPSITLFEILYGKEVLEALEIKLIDKNEVCLMPELIQK